MNAALGRLLGAVLTPFSSLPPIVGLAAVSLATAVGLLLVVRASSDQVALAEVKRQIQAGMFEIWLFRDDPRAMFGATWRVLRHNLTYLRLSLVPLAWIFVPMVLVMAQLHSYFGYDGLTPGQAALVQVRLESTGLDGRAPAVMLAVPNGVRLETPMVWIPSTREVAWRIAADEPGDYTLSIVVDGQPMTKTLRVSSRVGWRSPERPKAGLINELLSPAEAPIDAAVPVEAVAVNYPERAVNFLGWHTHWMMAFFVLSMVFALVLRKRLGVVI